MHHIHHDSHRSILAPITIAFALAGASPACADDGDSHSHSAPEVSELALRDTMRALWIDHVTWTRLYLVSAIAELPDADAVAARLLRNQDDIGAAIVPYYGQSAGDALTALLREHITIAVELVAAAKTGNTSSFADARARWTDNAEAVADLLSGANPNWPRDDMAAMMEMHLEQTLAEATARLEGRWDDDIAAYDEVVAHITSMADLLTDGLAAQFPDEIGPEPCTTAAQEELHLAMRALWAEHVTWTRVYLVSAIAGLPDADSAAARLLGNQDAIGAALVPWYGAEAGDAVAALLRDHILIAADIVIAAKSGDDVAVAAARAAWEANADAIASFLAEANPAWPLADLQAMMHLHLEQTITSATARLTGDWPRDIAAYDEIVAHILTMADVLSDGISGRNAPAATSDHH